MADIKNLKPKVLRMANQLIADCAKNGLTIIITQGYRSIADQNAIYAQGRTKPGKIVSNAKGGSSLHNFGVAFDICFIQNKKAYYPPVSSPMWKTVAALASKIGLEWGDRGYVDIPHFQFRNGHSLADFQNNKVNWNEFK